MCPARRSRGPAHRRRAASWSAPRPATRPAKRTFSERVGPHEPARRVSSFAREAAGWGAYTLYTAAWGARVRDGECGRSHLQRLEPPILLVWVGSEYVGGRVHVHLVIVRWRRGRPRHSPCTHLARESVRWCVCVRRPRRQPPPESRIASGRRRRSTGPADHTGTVSRAGCAERVHGASERGALAHPIANDVSLAPVPHLVIRPSPATGSVVVWRHVCDRLSVPWQAHHHPRKESHQRSQHPRETPGHEGEGGGGG